MSKRVGFEVTATSAAPRQTVFALVQNGASWPTWSPLGSFELHRPSADGGEGVGAIRYFKTGNVTSQEEIVALTPGRSLSYVAFAGLPLKDHRADVELSDAPGGGTTIIWREAFRPRYPGTGWLIRRFLRCFVQKCADGLAQAAAKAEAPAADAAERSAPRAR